MKLFLFFGTSTTWGAWDPEGGWVERLRKHCFKDHFIYNVGVSGDTTREVVKRFEPEARARLEDFEYDDIVTAFSIGGNDASWLIKEKRPRVPEEEFRSNVLRLYEGAKKIGSTVYFLSSTPVDEAKTTSLPWAPELGERNDLKARYSEVLKDFCEKNRIPFINIFSIWNSHNYIPWLDDGLHPNAEGHRQIYEVVRRILKL